MMLRNLLHPDVQATRYLAHGGGIAHMVLTTPTLRTLMFLAHASVPPGNKLLGHMDPMEEIYIIQKGTGLMQVGKEIHQVKAGDAIHIPLGHYHELTNTGNGDMTLLVVAGLIPSGDDL